MTRKDSRETSSSLKSLHIESKSVSPTPSRGSSHERNGDRHIPGIDVSRPISADIIDYHVSEASSPSFNETKHIPDICENKSEHNIISRTESQQSYRETQDDKLFHSHITSDAFTKITNQS